MIPILTLAEIKEVERRALEAGLSEYDLILGAGQAVFASVQAMLAEAGEDSLEGGTPPLPPYDLTGDKEDAPRAPLVAFVCGKGHNGADALATAMLCAQSGIGVTVYQIHSDRYSPETRRLQDQLAEGDVAVHAIRSTVDLPVFEDADLIVDGLLGSGLRDAPAGLLASLIHGINRSGRPVLSIDVPSGVGCDSGEIPGSAVRADSTVCLGALKPSALFYPASIAYGKAGYSPAALDEKSLSGQPSKLAMYNGSDALLHLPLKGWDSNKYKAGKVLVIAGSRGMHGAAALCANAALRSGAGIVRVAVPAGIYRDLSAHLLEIIGAPLGSGGDGCFAPPHVAELEPWIPWADAIVLGPGLGKHPDTLRFVEALLPLLRGRRVIVDGDALALFGPGEAAPGEGLERFILTPHAGEYRRMGGEYDYSRPLELLENARAFSRGRGLHLILKGPTTLCAEHGRVKVSASGNPGMATAGTGDVLAGILGSLLAHLPPEDASPLAVFLHGRAGEAARRDRGMSGMTASDLVLYLPLAIKELEDMLEEGDEDD